MIAVQARAQSARVHRPRAAAPKAGVASCAAAHREPKPPVMHGGCGTRQATMRAMTPSTALRVTRDGSFGLCWTEGRSAPEVTIIAQRRRGREDARPFYTESARIVDVTGPAGVSHRGTENTENCGSFSVFSVFSVPLCETSAVSLATTNQADLVPLRATPASPSGRGRSWNWTACGWPPSRPPSGRGSPLVQLPEGRGDGDACQCTTFHSPPAVRRKTTERRAGASLPR